MNNLPLSNDKLRILVVEDSPGDIFLIKFYLEELDPHFYEIDSVHTLEEAHKKLTYDNFDVTLLDFHLPDSEGMITLTSSVAKFPNQIFIVLTGLSDEKIGFEAVKNGAHDYLVKGRIDGKVLDSSIKFAVERNRIKEKIFQYYESLTILEKIHDEVAFIVDLKNKSLQHSEVFNLYIGTNEKIKNLENFYSLMDNPHDFSQKIENIKPGEVASSNVIIDGTEFFLKFGRGVINQLVVGTVKKAN
jgi:DNA-binding response OmpR family regulator